MASPSSRRRTTPGALRRPLRRRSSGLTPQARFWTLTLYDPEGKLVANSVNRYGFTSQEVVRNSDGSFDITVAPRARSGNWLPTGGIERYTLVLRLYDSPVGVATRAGRETPMPSIAEALRMIMRWLLWLLGGLLLGGIVHLATVLMLPDTATQDAYARLSRVRRSMR